MADDSGNSAAPLEPLQTSELAPGSINQSSQPSPPSPGLSQEPEDLFDGWEIIGEQQAFYDEQDCLYPSHSLASEKLGARKDDDVVIFDYSLGPDYLGHADSDPLAEEGAPPGRFSADDDIFFRVAKQELIGSKQFDQIVNPPEEPRPIQSRGSRLGIIDFPQCCDYDTSDDNPLNSIAEKLGLPNPTAFKDAHSNRVEALPGSKRFRTGLSLRVPFKDPSELSKSGSSEDKFILFISFPYFGGSREVISLDSESESVGLLDFKRLGVYDPGSRAVPSGEKEDDIGKILVHQARYMIFDNNTMVTFRSKEDSAKDRVPLHRFQERVGAFRAMIHMIANRMELEPKTLERLQASLCKLEEDIDQIISDASTYEDNQGMERASEDDPPNLEPSLEVSFTGEGELRRHYERARQERVQKRKQKRVRDLLTSLNRLSAALFAAISVTERQISVLQDIHSVFLTSYRTKAKDGKKGLRRNPFHRNVATIPILSENPEQIWPNTLETIDEVVRERKSFITKIKELVENMDIRRKIFSAFLKSDQAKAAPSEKTAQETTGAVKRAEDAVKETTKAIAETRAELVKQGQTLSGFTLVTTAFLPLSFCTSYYGMQTVKEFDSSAEMSLSEFWWATGPAFVGVLLLTVLVIVWRREWAENLRSRERERWRQSRCGKYIIKRVWPWWLDLIGRSPQAPGGPLPLHHPPHSMAAPLPPTTLQLGSGPGGIPLVAVPLPVSSLQPPSGPLSQPQQSPSEAWSTSPTSTSNPKRVSDPLSSAGQPSTLSLPPTPRQSDTHAP